MPDDPGSAASPQDRQPYIDAVLESQSRKRLIVAGPGTGKSYLFRIYLERNPGTNIVLTFINSLVAELDRDLSEFAVVRTFHSYCKSLLHQLRPGGITASFDYYPPIAELLPLDVSLIRGGAVAKRDIERALHLNDDATTLITDYLRSAEYYDAVGHDDAVARVVRFLTDHASRTPRIEHLVVDEVQDFNRLEMDLIELLTVEADTLAAGDDDQALYAFKEATPEFIRELAERGDYEKFVLPYCSRCTAVIVDAVHDVIDRARSRGALAGRLEKDFDCFLPAKAEDSKAHPKIIHAVCSVSRKNAPYMARYVAGQVKAIPAVDIEAARSEGYPTALVIGPSQFLAEMHSVLAEAGGIQVTYHRAPNRAATLMDGYLRVLRNPSSRLGWRLIVEFDPFEGFYEAIAEAHSFGAELANLIPEDYRARHLAMVDLLARLERGEPVDDGTLAGLLDAVGMELAEIQRRLEILPPEVLPEADPAAPTVIITTLTGAKGLSAAYVFVVGLMNGHLPRHPASPTDTEICQFIVALTRTRKQCHFVSARRFGQVQTTASSFIGWVAGSRLEAVQVSRGYFD